MHALIISIAIRFYMKGDLKTRKKISIKESIIYESIVSIVNKGPIQQH